MKRTYLTRKPIHRIHASATTQLRIGSHTLEIINQPDFYSPKSRHSAWPRRRYWRYRNLIDWYIVWAQLSCTKLEEEKNYYQKNNFADTAKSKLSICRIMDIPNIQCETAKSMNQFHIISGPSGVLVSIGKRPSQTDVFWNVSWKLQLKWLNGQIAGDCSKEKGHRSEMLLHLRWFWP